MSERVYRQMVLTEVHDVRLSTYVYVHSFTVDSDFGRR